MGFKRNYLVCYDISNDSGRNKAVKILEGFGYRIQYSIFQCRLNKRCLNQMRDALEALSDSMTDEGTSNKIYIYPLCSSCFDERIIMGEKEGLIDSTNVLVL